MEQLHKQVALLQDRIVQMRAMLDDQDRLFTIQMQNLHRANNNNANVGEVCA